MKSKPIVVDAAYRPRDTALIRQAEAASCKTFVGVQMLIEQGIVQFELWTGLSAPRELIEVQVMKFYNS